MEAQVQVAQASPRAGWPPLMSLLCLAVSVALLLPQAVVEASLGSTPRLAWCALFWVATLSLPQADRGQARWSVSLGLGLCALGLAAHLDLARGFTVEQVWTTAWPTLLFLVLLPGAAARARAMGTAARHALLWFVLVPGAPLFAHALEDWGGVELPGWLEFIASASPLSWLAERVAGGGALPWLPLGVAVLLFAATATSTGESPATVAPTEEPEEETE